MMQALSIRQPWAWLILFAGKDVENRIWTPPASMIGRRFLIHAAKTCTEDELEAAEDFAGCYVPTLETLDRGGIVGVCRLAGWVRKHADGRRSGRGPGCMRGTSRWFVGPVGFLLDEVEALPFTPLRGNRGFFPVAADVVRRLGVTP